MSEEKIVPTNEQITEALKKVGATCRSCWWQEGGRCYVEPCERFEIPGQVGSYSKRMADGVCHEHTSKRKVLASVFPTEMLTIASEKGGT